MAVGMMKKRRKISNDWEKEKSHRKMWAQSCQLDSLVIPVMYSTVVGPEFQSAIKKMSPSCCWHCCSSFSLQYPCTPNWNSTNNIHCLFLQPISSIVSLSPCCQVLHRSPPSATSFLQVVQWTDWLLRRLADSFLRRSEQQSWGGDVSQIKWEIV